MNCMICDAEQLWPYGGVKNDLRFVKCHDCGYVVASPMPTQAELDALYTEEHFKSSYHPAEARNTELLAQREAQYDQDRELLLEFVRGGRLLDFGCGNGHFLAGFPDSFERLGYEFNRTTTAYLKEHAEFAVLDSLQEVHDLPDGSLDVATMRGVIEHLIDPERVLALLAEKLSVGGVLFLCATPNVDSPAALVYGMNWNQFTPPYHLHFFSPRTIALLGARHGLALIESRTPYLGTPYESEAQDSRQFLREVNDPQRSAADGALATETRSPPFPGTMMSLVLRKVE